MADQANADRFILEVSVTPKLWSEAGEERIRALFRRLRFQDQQVQTAGDAEAFDEAERWRFTRVVTVHGARSYLRRLRELAAPLDAFLEPVKWLRGDDGTIAFEMFYRDETRPFAPSIDDNDLLQSLSLREDVVELLIDPGEASAETVADLLVALSNLHVALGGGPLTFREDEQPVVRQPALVTDG